MFWDVELCGGNTFYKYLKNDTLKFGFLGEEMLPKLSDLNEIGKFLSLNVKHGLQFKKNCNTK